MLPKSCSIVNRSLYFYEGGSITIANEEVKAGNAIDLEPNQNVMIECKGGEANILLLQGKPINEPVAQYGPFVMNNQAEIQQTMLDYQQTQFGGWPWPNHEFVHPRDKGRFAKYSDGSMVEKD